MTKLKKEMENFEKRWFTRAILPGFFKAGQNTNGVWSEIRVIKENHFKQRLRIASDSHYDRLSSYVDGVDYSQYPQAELSYYTEALQKIQEYINHTEYHQVTLKSMKKSKKSFLIGQYAKSFGQWRQMQLQSHLMVKIDLII